MRQPRSPRALGLASVMMALAACSGAPTPGPSPQAAVTPPTVPSMAPTTETPSAPPVAEVQPATPKAPAEPAPPSEPEGPPRLYAPSGLVRIYEKPDRSSPVLGAFRAGQSVVLKDASLPAARTLNKPFNCTEGWYPVEPRGFVCVGGKGFATKDSQDPTYLAAKATLPDFDRPYPYHYGTSVGAPQYLRIPTLEEQRATEPDLDNYLKNLPAPDPDTGAVSSAKAGVGPSKAWLAYEASAKPELLHDKEAYDGYKVAWTREFDANGRTWLITPTMTLVPKDKVRVSEKMPTLKGIDLRQTSTELPLAFFWLDDAKKFVKNEHGMLVETEEVYQRHSFVPATMEQAAGPKGVYWKMKDGGYVHFRDATIIRPSKRPGGVGKDEKWVEVRITWGFLIAYEGDTPVYATAVSPGANGINKKGHTTAIGRHYVDWKLFTGDMSGRDGGQDWFIEEVPWVQYYKGNYAFHGAFWHNDFGRPKSHGCVNLAPADAQALFKWMDPVIPEGWYAASAYYPHVKGTFLLIRH